MSGNILRYIGGAVPVLVCALGLTGTAAYADMPDVVFEITAEAGGYSTTVPILAEWGDYNEETGVWSWEMPAYLEFWDDFVYLGTMTEFTVNIHEDPEVNLNFAVQSGSEDTDFHIASALLSFDPITEPEGRASATFTMTDFDGSGATLTGIGDPDGVGGGYLAQYNGWAGDPFNGPQGTTFAEGITSMSAGAYQTDVENLNVPESGWLPIDETVYDMSSLISFTLTANDLASGTSHYEIVPEPGALMMLAVGGLALLRRR
jgi:hypothetical protein